MSEIIPVTTTHLRPITSPEDFLSAHNELADFIAGALIEGKDYGVIAGEKATLFKAGAERLVAAMGCSFGRAEVLESEIEHDRINVFETWNTRPEPERAEKDRLRAEGTGRSRKDSRGQWYWQELEENRSRGLYRYLIGVGILRHGEMIGYGMGACSTMETKYIRQPRDCENTVAKMALKRARVDAAMTTFALSDRFSPDDSPDLAPPAPTEEAPKATVLIGMAAWKQHHCDADQWKLFEEQCAAKFLKPVDALKMAQQQGCQTHEEVVLWLTSHQPEQGPN